MMKKILTIKILFLLFFQSEVFGQNQRVLLLGDCNDDSVSEMLKYTQQTAKIFFSTDKSGSILEKDISSYPIIMICSNDYLKLKNNELSILQNHLKQGGLLIMDNISSEYTFSIFLNNILPEFSTKSLTLSMLIPKNPYKINFDDIDVKFDAVFINNRLSVLAVKESSLLDKWIAQDEKFLKIGSSIIINNLTN